MSSLIPLSSLLVEQGVHFIGDFAGRSSLSQSGRDVVEVIRSLNVPVEIFDVPLSPERYTGLDGVSPAEAGFQKPASRLSIAHCNADSLAFIAKRLPREMFAERRIIGIWYWETEILPESHRKGFDFVDEVWVTSKFVGDSIARESPVPVKHFPHLIEIPSLPERMELPESLRNGRFMFLFCFDYRSMVRRKNPEGVCEAFIRAFPEARPDGPLCVIKSVAGAAQFGIDYCDLRLRFRHRPDILFFDGWMSAEERDCLMARADCYVSLHRAEGLGMTLLESMALGKPCIGTRYSGNLDFMNDENSWLIPCKMVEVGPGAPPFPHHHLWAEPNLDAAAAAMREVMSDSDLAQKRGRLGRETVIKQHGLETVSARFRQLLEDAIQAPVRTKPGIKEIEEADSGKPISAARKPVISARARAYEILKEARSAQGEIRSQIKQIRHPHLQTKLRECLETMLGIIRLQQKSQSEILRELGDAKKRLHEFEAGEFNRMLRDREAIGRIFSAVMDESAARKSGSGRA